MTPAGLKVLRIAENYHPRWQARSGEEALDVIRLDDGSIAVLLPDSEQAIKVELQFKP